MVGPGLANSRCVCRPLACQTLNRHFQCQCYNANQSVFVGVVTGSISSNDCGRCVLKPLASFGCHGEALRARGRVRQCHCGSLHESTKVSVGRQAGATRHVTRRLQNILVNRAANSKQLQWLLLVLLVAAVRPLTQHHITHSRHLTLE